MSAAVDLFLEATAPLVSASTLAVYRHYLTRFAALHNQLELTQLSPALILRWSQRYHPVGIVQRLCRWAKCEARLIAVNPLEGMRKVRNGHRRRVLSRYERARLLRAARPALRAFAAAMLETMARPREMRNVRWGDIRTCGSPLWDVLDLAAGRCFFWLTKFKGQSLRRDPHAVRVIPISPRLGRLLARKLALGVRLDGPIFLNDKGMPWTHNAVRCQFRRIRGRAGLTADVAGEHVVAYSLRHTAATDAVGAGVKGFTLAELMGHSDVRMTQRYVHLRPDHLIAAANQVYEWKQGKRRKKTPPRIA